MLKRILCIVLCIFSLCITPVSAAETRAGASPPNLSFDGTTAVCTYQIIDFGSKIEVTLELWRGSICVAEWTKSGTSIVSISQTYNAVVGSTYTLIAKGTVDGVAFTSPSVVKTC